MSFEAPSEASPFSQDLQDRPQRIRIFVLLIGFTCAGLFIATQLFAIGPSPTVQGDVAEVVVLKNGGTFSGSVVEHADHLVVRMDNGGEVRLPYDQVDFRAPTLREAYVILAERNTEREARYYLGLCDWCLKQSLLDEAAWQLELAVRSGAENRFVDSRRHRLESLLAVARADAARQRQEAKIDSPGGDDASSVSETSTPEILLTSGESPIASEQITPESIAEEMPEALQLAFQQQVQPRLIHGCSAARCHGPSTPTGFELERVARGKPVTRLNTQRNLIATLQLVDPPQPDQSPLLTYIGVAHAGAQTPIYPRREGEQGDHFRAIESWVVEVSEFIMSRQADRAPGHADGSRLVTDSFQPQRNPLERSERDNKPGFVQSIPTYNELIQSEESTPSDRITANLAGSTASGSQSVPGEAGNAPKKLIQRASFWETDSEATVDIAIASPSSRDASNGFVPRDPFDPEIFNRYIRGELKPIPVQPSQENVLPVGNGDFPPPRNQIEPPSREISPRASASRN